MKRYAIWLLLAVVLVAVPAGASELGISVDAPGYLVVEMPEAPLAIVDGKVPDPYMIRWEAMAGVQSYQVTVMHQLSSPHMEGLFLQLAQGFVQEGFIEGADGQLYQMPFAVMGGVELEGEATEIDIAPMMDTLLGYQQGEAVKGYYLVIMVMPEVGKPVVQIYEISA